MSRSSWICLDLPQYFRICMDSLGSRQNLDLSISIWIQSYMLGLNVFSRVVLFILLSLVDASKPILLSPYSEATFVKKLQTTCLPKNVDFPKRSKF